MTETRSDALAVSNSIILQRLEGVAAFAFAIVAYAWLGQSWLLFALLLLVPDISMLGYLHSRRQGTLTYNLGHNYVLPALLAASGPFAGPLAYGLAAIWMAHIGLDRALGYGLKLESGFDQTHLGPIGKARHSGRSTAS